MNSITPINLQKVSYLRNNQPQSLSVPNAVGQSSGDAYVPSFRGYEKTIGKNGLIAGLSSLVVTLFTGIFAKKNVESKAVDTAPQEKEPELLSDRDKAFKINPVLTDKLAAMQHYESTSSYDEELFPDYNDRMILRIVEANEKDPKYAFQLANFLKNIGARNVTEEDTDYLIKKFNENPEEAFASKKYNHQYTIKRLHKIDTLKAKDPELLEYAEKNKLDVFDTYELYELKQQYPKSAELVFNSKLNPKGIAQLMPLYGEYKDSINGLIDFILNQGLKLIARDVAGLAKAHKAEPEKIEKAIEDYRTTESSFIKQFKDIPAEEVKQIIEDYPDPAYRYMNGDILYKHYKYAPILNPLTQNISNPEERYEFRQKIVEELGKELDETMPKMIKDGRIPQTEEELYTISHVYAKYPNIEITDDVIKMYCTNGGLADLFNLG